MSTRAWDQINGRVHALGRGHRSRVAQMCRLTARLAPAFHAATGFPLPVREAIGVDGFDVLVELCCRKANCRSRSAICFPRSAIAFACSAICRSRSANSRRSRSTACFSRSARSLPRARLGLDTRQTVRPLDQLYSPLKLYRMFPVVSSDLCGIHGDGHASNLARFSTPTDGD